MKPLLAAVAELDKIAFPVYTQPKLDGIRAMVKDCGVVSRTGKSIPNRHIRDMLESIGIHGFDGEIITYRRGKPDRFENVSSKVMSAAGEPEFVYHVFDCFSRPYEPFERRMEDLFSHPCFIHYSGFLRPVECGEAYSLPDLMRLHRSYVKQGFEGTIIRSPEGNYKSGRSTVKEGYLLKLKDFDDSEARIIGFVERLNHLPSLGAFVMSWRGVEFNIGTGFTETQMVEYWNRRHSLIGKAVTFSYQGVGSNGRPRFPAFVGFRRDSVAA